MKKIILSTVMILAVITLFAQGEWTNSSGNIYTNAATYPNTNVGINTTSPTQDLNIVDSDGSCNLQLESGYNEAGNKTLGSFLIKHNPTGDMFFTAIRKWNGVNEMVQSCYDAGTTTWCGFSSFDFDTKDFKLKNGIVDVFYENTGGVGINTTTIPTGYKLAVGGKVIVEGLDVQLSGSWPDYVFRDDYKLMTLPELENFIDTHGHLPEVPSANELENGVINVAEMDALLLQKVEELTLYLIQLKEENNLLKDRIEKLEE